MSARLAVRSATSAGPPGRVLPAVALATVVVIALASVACGYSLVGTGSFLPQYIRTVAIPTFANNTPRFEVEIRMTDAVTREMVSRGSFSVVAEQEGADAVLLGTILDFTVTPVGLGVNEEASNYMVTIRAQVNFRDLVENRVLFSNNSFLFREQFEIEQSPGDFFDVTNVAIDEIAEQFARSVVSSILEGF
jgi:hypothetical protein